MNSNTKYAIILKDGQEPVIENGRKVLYLSPDQVGTLYRQQPYAFRTIAQDVLDYTFECDSDLHFEKFFGADGMHEHLAGELGKLMDASDPVGNEEKYWHFMKQVVDDYAKSEGLSDGDDDGYEDEDDEYREPESSDYFELDPPLFYPYYPHQ